MRKLIMLILILTMYIYGQCADIESDNFEKIQRRYLYDKTKSTWVPKQLGSPEENIPDRRKENKSKSTDSPNLDILAYILLGVVLSVVIYLLMSENKKGKKISSISDNIEDIASVDTVKEYDIAIAAVNYRVAVRMKFIKLLQYLDEKQYIKWQKEKTNMSYYHEIGAQDVKKGFKDLASIYERTWYGAKELDQAAFEIADDKFDSFFTQAGIIWRG